MIKQIREHRVPVAVTLGALIIAVVFGIMPLRDTAVRADAREMKATSDRIEALETRLAALEATLLPDASDASGPPPTREEIALIVRGLVNQTGRVSRLQDQVEGIISGEIATASDPRASAEISLAKRGLANLTRRINAMKKAVAPLETLPRTADQLSLRMLNVESAVTQLHRRIRAAQSETSSSTEADLDEIATQLEQILMVIQEVE